MNEPKCQNKECGHPKSRHTEPFLRLPFVINCLSGCLCPGFEANVAPSPTPKLKLQLILLGESSLYVKVEEVDARWIKSLNNSFVSSHSFVLEVCYAVKIEWPHFYFSIRKDGKCQETTKTFSDADGRDKWITLLKSALKEWAENWEGFKSCTPSCTNHCPPHAPARVEKKEHALEYWDRGVSTTVSKVINYTIW